MASSVAAISTASMGAYELAYFKIPTIIVAVAKNQEIGVSQFIRHNLASGSIFINNNEWKTDIKNKIEHILQQKNRYTDNAISNDGTDNIVNEVLGLIQ